MNSKSVVWLTLVILLFSCNKKISTIFDRSGDRIVVNEAQFQYLTAKAKVEYSNDGKDISGIANIRMQRDSAVWISLSPGFGVEVARALITRDSIQILDKINKIYIGMNFATLSQNFDFEINYPMVEALIVGNLIYPYKRERLEKKNANLYTYVQEVGTFEFVNFIGSNSMKLERLEVQDLKTQNSVLVDYKDFQYVSEQVLPFQINAKFDYADKSKSPTKIGIELKQSEIEEKELRFPFNVPSKYERR